MASTYSYQHDIPTADVERMWDRGHIRPYELLRIAAWKSAISVARLTVNAEEEIEGRTRDALVAITPFRKVDVVSAVVDWTEWRVAASTAIGSRERGTGLLGLTGVGFPLATAVLAVLAPTAFPVVDKWALAGVFGVDPAGTRGRVWQTAERYLEYARRLAESTDPTLRGISSIHERDRRVMNTTRAAYTGTKR